MKELNRRKKIHLNTEKDKLTRIDKIDNVQLLNLDKNLEEITDKSEMIEANTKILVKRLPMKMMESMEVSYNQMNNSLTKFKDQRKVLGISLKEFNQIQQQIEDENEFSKDEQDDGLAEQDEAEEKQMQEIDSYSIDIKSLNMEFQCPISIIKGRQIHIISNPIIATCCGKSACLSCFVEAVVCE